MTVHRAAFPRRLSLHSTNRQFTSKAPPSSFKTYAMVKVRCCLRFDAGID